MLQEEITLYIRENGIVGAIIVGIILFILLAILFQVTRTRREVHKICRKIQKYFDVVLTDEVPENPTEDEDVAEEGKVPVYEMKEEFSRQEEQKNAEDAKLLMDVIQEVF